MITSNPTYCFVPALSTELADDSAWEQIATKTQAGLELDTTCSKSRATQAQTPRGVELIAWPMLVHPLLHVTLIHKVQLVTLQTQPRNEYRNQCSEVPYLTKHLWGNFHILIFVCPCIFSIIRNWWPRRCNFLVYLFVPNQLYMFRAMFSPTIRSTWLYLQLLI